MRDCRDCGQHVNWVAFECDENGRNLRTADDRAIVHRCEPTGHRSTDVPGTTFDNSVETARMPFGKHGPKDGKPGTLISELDPTYINWLLGRGDTPGPTLSAEWLIKALKHYDPERVEW